jgi:GT2 family glycosyltransferase
VAVLAKTGLRPNFMSETKAYAVRGLGEREPAEMRLTPPDLDRAIAICDEEIALIERAIKTGRIPIPPALADASPPEHNIQVAGSTIVENARVEDGTAPPVNGGHAPFLTPIASLMNWGRYEEAADDVAKIAAGRDIVVAGDDAWALASALRTRGAAATWLRAGGSVLPRRWRRPSFEDWLARHGGDLAGVGALVLVGNHAFEAERAALRDASAAPPVIRVADNDAGVPAVADLIVPQEDGVAWPKISVVTVSFNQGTYLEASIRSVLDQRYPNLEYIVVDGGSTDGSIEIIERYRDRCDTVIVEPDRGQSDALNKGFARATGEIMTWLCSDDLLEPGSLEAAGRAYGRYGADVIAGGCVRIGESRGEVLNLHHAALPLGRTMKLEPLDILSFMRSWQSGKYFYQPEVFFSRRAWRAAGAYLKEHLYYAMDYDLWLRLALAGATVRRLPVPIGCSRVHAQQKTQDDKKYLHQMRELMKEYRTLFEALRAHDRETAPVQEQRAEL